MYKPHTIEQYKIQLIDEQGAERTLLLSKTAKFQIGARYRFYFQKGSRNLSWRKESNHQKEAHSGSRSVVRLLYLDEMLRATNLYP